MKNYEKEVLKARLDAEANELKHLKAIYNKASEDIIKKIEISNGKINVLLSNWDNLTEEEKSIYQSQIYQRDFQKSLKTQIDGFLKDLNSKQYATMTEYMEDCYKNGYLGAMYSIHKQGIPIISPIDQKKVTKAMFTDSKISKKLYTKLGEDVEVLKKRIANNLSRGIATASEYKVIARNIAADSNVGFNRAMRIARTEGGRISNESAYDASIAAKEKGADVLKSWDAALDGRTRESHARVDGEIRELDEKFSNGLKYPGDSSGGAAEVVNCRCALLQRAKWALDDGDFTKMNNFTKKLETFESPASYEEFKKGFFSDGNVKYMNYVERMEKKYRTKDFRKVLDSMTEREYKHYSKLVENNPMFNKKYLKAAENVASKATSKTKKVVEKTTEKVYKEGEKLDISNFSQAFTAKAEAKNTHKLVDYVNNLEGANPAVMKLYNSIGKLEKYSDMGIDFKISHASSHAVSTKAYYSGQIIEVKLTIPKLTGDNLAGQVNTTLHENMHLIDMMLKEKPDSTSGKWFSAASTSLVDAFKKTDESIGDEIKALFEAHDKEHKAIVERLRDAYNKEHEKLVQKYLPNGVWGEGANYKEYQKQQKKLHKLIFDEQRDYESRNIMGGGIGDLQDIYDALSGGEFMEKGIVKYGHGRSYYRNSENRILETIANYGSLSVTRPDLVEMLRKDKPELTAALDDLIEEMVRKVDSIE